MAEAVRDGAGGGEAIVLGNGYGGFVALQMAYLLGIKIELNLNRTPEQWAKIRRDVQQTMQRELSRTKK